MKTLLATLGLFLALTMSAHADQYYCHTSLWGGELAFQNTGAELKPLAAQILSQCQTSIGAADADECATGLTCDLLDDAGNFKSAIDMSGSH